ncbi:DUF3895 domain-containing protein [Gorillibacterium sp. sgz5001074]|uniref:DUF3895 domain-containing protein n=1 Tax=Gorillibacterium sp. sgz5001074 TaxID=3446695 RepID=UPI003F6726A1
MLSVYDLTVEERDRLLALLNPEQRRFADEMMVRGRKTQFARIMASRKGAHIPEDASFEEIEMLVDDWIYLRYEDAGEVTDALKCDCGRSLRYAHTVKNLKTGQTHTFGITHLELHTGIDAKVVAQIKDCFEAIDFELHEILSKMRDGWTPERAIGDIPSGLALPGDISRHLELGLPLLDRQTLRLKRLIRQHLTVSPPIRPRVAAALRQSASSPPAPETPAPKKRKEPEFGQVAFDLFGEADLFGDGGGEPPLPEPPPEEAQGQDDGTVPFGAFPETSAPASSMGGQRSTSLLSLEVRLQSAVRQALRQGMQSARVISELLISSYGGDDRRYSTGKPYLYTAVCSFLDELAAAGEMVLLERDQNDRTYSLPDRLTGSQE